MDIFAKDKSSLSLTERDRVRKQHINSSYFDPVWMGEGGPIYKYQHCGFVTDMYRDNYDQINWSKEET